MLTKNISFLKAITAMGLTALVITIYSCYYNNAGLEPIDCTITPAKFATNVLPVIQTRCAIAGCHDATASGGIILQNYNQISTVKDRIKTRAVIQKTMPLLTPLNFNETAILKCWIEGGALND